MKRLLLPFVIAVGMFSIPATAADLTVKNVHLGSVLHGPPLAGDQLDDSVVFVEEWGIH
ncbi:MAG TPA: hypothetical protein VH120_06625 [Gemmataceae bacterium]|nr:hypothetical protein [Gemmataceae bacterium]